MTTDRIPLKIVPLFNGFQDQHYNLFYKEIVSNILDEILPPEIMERDVLDELSLHAQRKILRSLLPLFTYTSLDQVSFNQIPFNISFFALFKYRKNAFKFFFEMISQWLVPGRRLNVVLIYAVDFKLPEIDEAIYTLCDVTVTIENASELEELRSNLPIIKSEICLGIDSSYYARRFLEMKGFSVDVKTATIQEDIAYLMAHFHFIFDHDLLTQMQHVLVMCRDEFKAARECRHLSRMIAIQYVFQKELNQAVKEFPEKRHLFLKIFRAKVHTQKNHQKVLSLIVGMNFLKDEEIFEERHFLSAIQHHLPDAKAIVGSFFSNRRGTEHVCTQYIEIEKSSGEEFSPEEIRLLRIELPRELIDRIEHPMPPVFMPRNEEEIMRNILNLSNQIRFLHDTAQVIISFDQQTADRLFFTIILVRVVVPGSSSIQEKFKEAETCLDYVHDRSKTIGYLRKKYSKEANVFGVNLPKKDFIRRDYSIDLARARQTVLTEITKVLGEVRDFNGGMIAKQQELLSAVIKELEGVKYNDLILENFFYSITPDVMRAVLDPTTLQTLFLMQIYLLESEVVKESACAFKSHCNSQYAYLMVKTADSSLKEVILEALNQSDFSVSDVTFTSLTVYESFYLGYLYAQDDLSKQLAFCRFIQKVIEEWCQEKDVQLLADVSL